MKKIKSFITLGSICFLCLSINLSYSSAEPRNNKIKPEIPIKLPQTGQVWSERPGDDGDLQMGIKFPVFRFQDNNDGTITDRLTNLVWLKNADCFGTLYWYGALEASNNLKNGECGLSDNSVPGDWRLPNRNELLSLIDVEVNNSNLWDNTCLPSGHPFLNVKEDHYWTSTTAILNHPANAWSIYMYLGSTDIQGKGTLNTVWPVRSAN
jgi:hypothetical protein